MKGKSPSKRKDQEEKAAKVVKCEKKTEDDKLLQMMNLLTETRESNQVLMKAINVEKLKN